MLLNEVCLTNYAPQFFRGDPLVQHVKVAPIFPAHQAPRHLRKLQARLGHGQDVERIFAFNFEMPRTRWQRHDGTGEAKGGSFVMMTGAVLSLEDRHLLPRCLTQK